MVVIHLCVKLSVFCGFHGNGRHFEISKPQNHLYTCHTTFLLSFIQFQALYKFFTFFVAILKFLSLKIMCTHVRQNFWKVSSNSEHHSKPTMDINLQHHNLLGNQISPKSEDFCIWRPFCTLGNSCHFEFLQPPKSCHTPRWIFLQIFM